MFQTSAASSGAIELNGLGTVVFVTTLVPFDVMFDNVVVVVVVFVVVVVVEVAM